MLACQTIILYSSIMNRNPRPPRGRKDPATRSASQAYALLQTRNEHAKEIAQDYAEAIADLAAAHGEARTVDLARRLGVSHVTVIRAVARLRRDGYVTTRPRRSISLTEKGSRLAEESRERHEVVLEFLRALGVPERTAQGDAEGIEHHVSPETLAALKRYLAGRL